MTISNKTKVNNITIVAVFIGIGLAVWQYRLMNNNINHRLNVESEAHKFIVSCVSNKKLDKEKFNKLCEVAKENNYEIKMGLNSEDLTINQNNVPENLSFFISDRIVIAGIGSGGFIVKRFNFHDINREPHIEHTKFGAVIRY